MKSTRRVTVALALTMAGTACATATTPEPAAPPTTVEETGTTLTVERTTTTTVAARTTTTTTLDKTDGPVTFEELTRQPLVIQKGDIEIVFDQWFFSTFDPDARVTVTGPGGVLTEGPVAGVGAVMREDPPGLMHFFDSAGTEVAQLASEELFQASDEARAAAGL